MEIKLFKKEKRFTKNKGSSWLDIYLFWKLSILFLLLIIILSSIFGYYFFVQTNKEFVAPPVVEGGQTHTVNKEKIKKVLEYFSTREEKSNEILNSSAPIVDPSL